MPAILDATGKRYAAPSHPGGTGDGSGLSVTHTKGGDLIVGNPLGNNPGYINPNDRVDYSQILKNISTLTNAPLPTPDYSQINTAAGQLASADIANQILGYHAEQNRLINQGIDQSKLINQTGAAAANYVKPWAGETKQAYIDAANQQRGLASGYSTELQQAGQSASDQLVAQLRALGSTQAPSGQQLSQLGDVVSTMGGTLPGATLDTQAAGAYQAAAALPVAFRTFAMQEGLGAQGAAQQRADAYQPDIVKALASRGQLTNTYASTLGTQAQSAYSNALDVRKMQIGLQSSMADLMGKNWTQGMDITKFNAGQRIQYAKFQQHAIDAGNKITEWTNTFNQTADKLNEQAHHNFITERQQNRRITLARDTLQQKIDYQTAQLENEGKRIRIAGFNASTSRAQVDGFTTDSKGNVYALPNYGLVKDDSARGFHAVPVMTPAQKTAARQRATQLGISKMNANSTWAKTYGFWFDPAGQPHAVPDVTLVPNPKSNFGFDAVKTTSLAKLKPSSTQITKANITGADAAVDAVMGITPQGYTKDRKGGTQVFGFTAGTDGKITITDTNLFYGNGGQDSMHWTDAVKYVLTKTGGVLTPKQAIAFVDDVYRKHGVDPADAQKYNLKVDGTSTDPSWYAHQAVGAFNQIPGLDQISNWTGIQLNPYGKAPTGVPLSSFYPPTVSPSLPSYAIPWLKWNPQQQSNLGQPPAFDWSKIYGQGAVPPNFSGATVPSVP